MTPALGLPLTFDGVEYGDAAAVHAIEPAISPDDVFRETERFFTRYAVMITHAPLPLTLWTAGTYVADAFDSYAYLAVTSPTKQCGKTRLLELLEFLCHEPWRGITPSPAALYRFLDEGRPTLLLDEVEKLTDKRAGENELALIAILNAGHRRGASVMRCDGAAHELRKFEVYGPKALACIGTLPETIRDRSITIPMQRRLPSQTVERFRFSRAQAESKMIAEQLAGLMSASRDAIAAAYDALPDLDFLTDRDADLWSPLFSICAVIMPNRVPELKRAAILLSAGKAANDTDDSLPLRLLADLRTIWPAGEHVAATADLLARLKGIEDSPWAADFELNPRRLAGMLRPFGIEPRKVRLGAGTAKGYIRDILDEACARYLASDKAAE